MSRFIYSEIDGSFTSPPPGFDSTPSAEDVPRCTKARFRPCRACEEELETCDATLSSCRNDQPRKWVPELLEDGKSFRFYSELSLSFLTLASSRDTIRMTESSN